VILTTILYCLVQLAVDMVYAFIDPRIKAQYIRAGKPKKRSSKAAAARAAAAKPAAEYQPAALSAITASGNGAAADTCFGGGAEGRDEAAPARQTASSQYGSPSPYKAYRQTSSMPRPARFVLTIVQEMAPRRKPPRRAVNC
jgi:hypothetical protein